MDCFTALVYFQSSTCGAGEDEALDGLVLGAGGGGAGHGHAAHIRHPPALILQKQASNCQEWRLSLYLSPAHNCCQGTR